MLSSVNLGLCWFSSPCFLLCMYTEYRFLCLSLPVLGVCMCVCPFEMGNWLIDVERYPHDLGG